jgi:NADH:ubiquinone oxidoreductase subunit 2 (subunit N)
MSFNTFSFILIYYNKYKNINITTDGLGTNYIILLSGLSRKEPVLAATFTISLLSIAGIPPLAGFFSKYYILLTLVDHSLYLVSIIAVIFSVIACFYYIRIIQFMYFKNNSTFSIKDLADISYNNYGNTSYNNISSTSINKYNYNNNNDYSLSTIIIMGITLFIILTFIFYPSPLLIIVFDSIINTFI